MAVMFGELRATHAQVRKLPLAVTCDYHMQRKMLIVHTVNNSVKDITAYTITIRHKEPDGTQPLDVLGQVDSSPRPSIPGSGRSISILSKLDTSL